MSVTHGADVEALRASSRELADVAQVLFDVNVRLGGRVYDFSWNGPDATRFRGEWEGQYSPALGRATVALNQAAAAVAEQAADQERASSADGGASPATQSLLSRVKAQRDVVELYTSAYQNAQIIGALTLPEVRASLQEFNRAWNASEAFATPLAKATGTVLGTLGTVLTAHDFARGVVEGDASAVAKNGVPLGVAALAARGVLSAGAGAAVTGSWTVGTMAGNAIHEGIQGTTYGDRVADNFDAVFDRIGFGGVVLSPVITPIVMAKSGIDMLFDDGDDPPIP